MYIMRRRRISIKAIRLPLEMESLVKEVVKSEVQRLLKEELLKSHEKRVQDIRSFVSAGSYSMALLTCGMFWITLMGWVPKAIGIPLILAFFTSSSPFSGAGGVFDEESSGEIRI